MKKKSRNGGFSLVEISIALGVFAFSIISVFGLLSVALATSKDTQQDSNLASIIRNLDSDVRAATDVSSISLLAAARYYDITGRPLTSATGAYYKVTLTHSNSTTAKQDIIKGAFDFSTSTASGISQISKIYVWSAKIEYPAPSYNFNTRLVLCSRLE